MKVSPEEYLEMWKKGDLPSEGFIRIQGHGLVLREGEHKFHTCWDVLLAPERGKLLSLDCIASSVKLESSAVVEEMNFGGGGSRSLCLDCL